MARARGATAQVDMREVITAFKQAERANRRAAKTAGQFIERLESLGISFKVVETQEKGSEPDGRDQQHPQRQ